MSLYNGIDPIAFASMGVYTETYGSTSQANINNLFASFGLLEDAPNVAFSIVPIVIHHLKQAGAL